MINVNPLANDYASDDMVNEAKIMKLDIINQICKEIESDGENESQGLLNDYLNATIGQKGMIDWVLIRICGWTMKSLIDIAQKEGNIEWD